MHVFCVGMYRAGSTWQYEVVSHLLERHRGGRRLGFVTGEQLGQRDDPADSWLALKSHDSHAHFTAALTAGRAKGVYVCRDLRDVAFSLAHVYRTSFEDIVERQRYLHLCLANDEFWLRQPGVLHQRYEEIVADPAAGVTALADHLGIALTAGEAAEVAGRFSLEANRQRAAAWEREVRSRGINPDDPTEALHPERHTLLHWNHIRQGRVGGWCKQATPRQRLVLALVCGAWLTARGYEADDAWALESVAAIDRLATELTALHHENAGQRERLSRSEVDLRRAEERVAELERLGPVALRLAAWFHDTSVRYPRLRELFKRLLGGPARSATVVPRVAGSGA